MVYKNLIKPAIFITKLTTIKIIPLIFLMSCFSRKLDPLEKTSYDIKTELAKRGVSAYNLRFLGSGGSIKEEKINETYIFFSYPEAIEVSEARELIAKLTRDSISIIENNEEYYTSLKYPDNPMKVLHISISFSDKGNAFPTKGLSLACNFTGTISYRITDPDDPNEMRLKTILRESFEEAELILAQENSDINDL